MRVVRGGSWVLICRWPFCRVQADESNWASKTAKLRGIYIITLSSLLTILSGETQIELARFPAGHRRFIILFSNQYPESTATLFASCPASAQLRNSSQSQVIEEMPCHWYVNVLLIGSLALANEMREPGGSWCYWAEPPSLSLFLFQSDVGPGVLWGRMFVIYHLMARQ